MPELNNTETLDNLKAAFAKTTEALISLQWMAIRATFEGQDNTAELFQKLSTIAEIHAHGYIDFLKIKDEASLSTPTESTEKNIHKILQHLAKNNFAEMAQTAQHEGFHDIADWFQLMAKENQAQKNQLEQMIKK